MLAVGHVLKHTYRIESLLGDAAIGASARLISAASHGASVRLHQEGAAAGASARSCWSGPRPASRWPGRGCWAGLQAGPAG